MGDALSSLSNDVEDFLKIDYISLIIQGFHYEFTDVFDLYSFRVSLIHMLSYISLIFILFLGSFSIIALKSKFT